MKLVPALSLFSVVPIALVGCTAPASPRADGGTALVLADGYELGNYNPVAEAATGCSCPARSRRRGRVRCRRRPEARPARCIRPGQSVRLRKEKELERVS
ncbi:hypothetical protein GS866_22180 [Rhodococcus hoagii]|nr:hypothetical protein [Prescottella equi]